MALPNRSASENSLWCADRGFSLIELLIVITILAALAGVGLFFGVEFYRSYGLISEKNILISVLQTARARALSNIDESKHGVYLGGSNYLIFEGVNYVSRNSSLDQIVNASQAISRSGLQEISFNQLTGDPSVSGTVTLSDGAHSLVISIENEGRISW